MFRRMVRGDPVYTETRLEIQDKERRRREGVREPGAGAWSRGEGGKEPGSGARSRGECQLGCYVDSYRNISGGQDLKGQLSARG